jgi:hypothetical protein
MQGHELTELNGLAQSDRWFDSLSLGLLRIGTQSLLDIDKFVETQEHFLQDVLSGLDGHSKAALALIYMRNNSVALAIGLWSRGCRRRREFLLYCCPGGPCMAVLAQYVRSEGSAVWKFKHLLAATSIPV